MYQVFTKSQISEAICGAKDRNGVLNFWFKGQRYGAKDKTITSLLREYAEEFQDFKEVMAYTDGKLATENLDELLVYMKGKTFKLLIAGRDSFYYVPPSEEWKLLRLENLPTIEQKWLWIDLGTQQTLHIEPTEDDFEKGDRELLEFAQKLKEKEQKEQKELDDDANEFFKSIRNKSA